MCIEMYNIFNLDMKQIINYNTIKAELEKNGLEIDDIRLLKDCLKNINYNLIMGIFSSFFYVNPEKKKYDPEASISQIVENQVVRPYIFGKFMDLHPIVIYIFIFVCAKYFGVVGAIFAPAIAADACVFIEELYLKNMDE